MSINKIIKDLDKDYSIDKSRRVEIIDLLNRTISTEGVFDYIIINSDRIERHVYDELYKYSCKIIRILVLTEFCFYCFYIYIDSISSDSVSLKSFNRITIARINNSINIKTDIAFSDYKIDFIYHCCDKTIPKFLKKLESNALAFH